MSDLLVQELRAGEIIYHEFAGEEGVLLKEQRPPTKLALRAAKAIEDAQRVVATMANSNNFLQNQHIELSEYNQRLIEKVQECLAQKSTLESTVNSLRGKVTQVNSTMVWPSKL